MDLAFLSFIFSDDYSSDLTLLLLGDYRTSKNYFKGGEFNESIATQILTKNLSRKN